MINSSFVSSHEIHFFLGVSVSVTSFVRKGNGTP